MVQYTMNFDPVPSGKTEASEAVSNFFPEEGNWVIISATYLTTYDQHACVTAKVKTYKYRSRTLGIDYTTQMIGRELTVYYW